MRDYHLPGRSPVYATHGMAATSMPAATLTALDVLRAGGNALDAAIAACAVLCVIEPQSTGIGGDCFCLYAPAGTSNVIALNGSGRAPAAATIDWYEGQGITAIDNTSAHAVTVPGAMSAWAVLLAAYGRKGLDELLQPAIRFAAEGWPVHPKVSWDWQRHVPKLRKNGALSFLPGGRAPNPGDLFRQPALAETLRSIARHGVKAFYEGPIAADIVATLRARGGLHTEEDFAVSAADAEFVEPITLNWRGYDVYQCPPNGQGIAALQILNILEGFDLRSMGRNSPETLHTMIEAKKLAWADRAKFYADPAFAKIPLAGLLSKSYAAERRKLIDPNHAAKTVEAGNPALDQGDTIYMCAADDEGNMVSLIQSNYRGMGSGIVVPGLGFMFQDRGELFSMDPQHANVYAPGKRPFHTIIPGFVMKDGKPWEAFGVMGGGMQPQGHVQVLTNQIDFGLNVQEAGDASRWQHEGDNEPTSEKMTASGGYVEVESGVPYETVRELRKKGHDVRFDVGGYGGYQAIKVEMHDGQRVYVGASESRKDGMAAGY